MIRAISIDAAFANMGLARVEISPRHQSPTHFAACDIRCVDLKLVSTESNNKKTVRKSSDDLRRARELYRALHDYIQDAQVIFAEVPSGAQSAAAAKYLGAAMMLLATVPIPVIEVSPLESRRVVSGAKSQGVSKEAVIRWAAERWPDAPWLRHAKAGRVTGKGGKVLSTWKAGDLQKPNEHLADAMATVAAGVHTPEFQQLLALLNHATPSTTHLRPAPRRVPLD